MIHENEKLCINGYSLFWFIKDIIRISLQSGYSGKFAKRAKRLYNSLAMLIIYHKNDKNVYLLNFLTSKLLYFNKNVLSLIKKYIDNVIYSDNVSMFSIIKKHIVNVIYSDDEKKDDFVNIDNNDIKVKKPEEFNKITRIVQNIINEFQNIQGGEMNNTNSTILGLFYTLIHNHIFTIIIVLMLLLIATCFIKCNENSNYNNFTYEKHAIHKL
jgi:hypothetical protein